MPMTRSEKLEKVQRLNTAHKRTYETLARVPVTWELHPGTDIARNWTVITAAYSGLEQTIKYLIADENSQTISELIDFAEPNDEDGRSGNTYPYRTHNLAWLFAQLGDQTKDFLREFYARFQSLHSYISVGALDNFLEQVSGRKGTGYERWRYTLIEDKPLPKNSPEALVAIWGVCVQVAEDKVSGRQQAEMPDHELASDLGHKLETTVWDTSIHRQNQGEAFRDIGPEARTWLWKAGHPLNAFAEVFWHFSRYGSHGVEDASDWLSEAIDRWVATVLQDPAAVGQTRLRAFLDRARGHTSDGSSIRWNSNNNRFEAVPWSLRKRFQEKLPSNATPIGNRTRAATQLTFLWKAAKESGYRVLENRALTGPPGADVWFRTIEVQAGSNGNEIPVLTVWQQPATHSGLHYIVEECPQDEMSPSLRTWIVGARAVGKS